MEVVTNSAAETQELGRELARRLKGGEVIGLTGDLGSGKTTFVQGLAKGLGVKGRIISPTFVFIRPYRLFRKQGSLYHVDLYRVDGLSEVKGLGLAEIWLEPENIVVIEWAEKIEKFLPERTVRVYFDYLPEEGGRKIRVAGLGER